MNERSDSIRTDAASVEAALVEYLVNNHAADYTVETLPRDAPILEQQIIDSFAFMDTIEFVESTWGVSFEPGEQTAARLGSVRKIAAAVVEKLSPIGPVA